MQYPWLPETHFMTLWNIYCNIDTSNQDMCTSHWDNRHGTLGQDIFGDHVEHNLMHGHSPVTTAKLVWWHTEDKASKDTFYSIKWLTFFFFVKNVTTLVQFWWNLNQTIKKRVDDCNILFRFWKTLFEGLIRKYTIFHNDKWFISSGKRLNQLLRHYKTCLPLAWLQVSDGWICLLSVKNKVRLDPVCQR